MTTATDSSTQAPVIDVRDVAKSYGALSVLEDVTFSIDGGEIFGIVGPNGAGKTTLVESIGGLREPDGGSITVLGREPIRDRAELTQRLGIQLQESRLQKRARVGEILQTFSTFYDTPADWTELADRFGLTDKMDAPYSSLSGGMKQRLSIALALVGSPEIVILDELTTGLDPRARRSTWDAVERIRSAGVTVILVTHFMDEVERLCDRVMVLDGGRIAAIDTPNGLMRTAGAEQVMSFRPSTPVPAEELRALPEVAEVEVNGGLVTATGSGNMVLTVLSSLAERGVAADRLRVDSSSLEDSYLSLTGEASGSAVGSEAGE